MQTEHRKNTQLDYEIDMICTIQMKYIHICIKVLTEKSSKGHKRNVTAEN